MLKFHTKDKEVILKDNTVDLIKDGFTETYNKIIFTDNLAVSKNVITFICGPYIVTIKGKFYSTTDKRETAKIIEELIKEN